MPLVDLVMPKMGESIMEATILKWHKQPGDAVKQDETLLEIATDKVDSEVPSIADGIMEELLFQVNDTVPIGSVIARIRTGVAAGEQTTPIQAPPAQSAQIQSPQTQTPADRQEPVTQQAPPVRQETQSVRQFASATASNGQATDHTPSANRFYSPLVLNIASSEGVPLSELEAIHGTGNEGRVTKKDILQYITDRTSGSQTIGSPAAGRTYTSSSPASGRPAQTTAAISGAQNAAGPSSGAQAAASSGTTAKSETPPRDTRPSVTPAATVQTGNVEIIEMDRMRKLIAEHMVRSKHTSPHVTSFTEADVTNLVHWRDKVKKDFEKREGTKITFTPLFIEAIVHCIKKYPLINSSLEGDKIIIKKDINIGMATALPSGNLIVPVIRNADQLNLIGLTRHVNNLADNARQNKLKPEDIQGGTFTMTNVGTFGSLMGTPIINQPQVAILAVGAIKKRPMVLETAEGDSIAIRHMMYLSLSYDHRIVDGSLGASFLTAVAKELENFPPDRDF